MRTCPECQRRPSKRACPALGHDICPVCCATKRLVEIRCPSDCRYLGNAQQHPAAVVRRQQDRDMATLLSTMGRLSERQLQLFFLLASVLVRHKPDGFSTLADADVAEATGTLAATLETASRGLIYEPRPGSVNAARLGSELKAMLDELGRGGGSRFEREAAEVLRGIERGARHDSPALGGEAGVYLAVLGRVLRETARSGSEAAPGGSAIITP